MAFLLLLFLRGCTPSNCSAAKLAMAEASKRYVQIDELMEGVGTRLAQVMEPIHFILPGQAENQIQPDVVKPSSARPING